MSSGTDGKFLKGIEEERKGKKEIGKKSDKAAKSRAIENVDCVVLPPVSFVKTDDVCALYNL